MNVHFLTSFISGGRGKGLIEIEYLCSKKLQPQKKLCTTADEVKEVGGRGLIEIEYLCSKKLQPKKKTVQNC